MLLTTEWGMNQGNTREGDDRVAQVDDRVDDDRVGQESHGGGDDGAVGRNMGHPRAGLFHSLVTYTHIYTQTALCATPTFCYCVWHHTELQCSANLLSAACGLLCFWSTIYCPSAVFYVL